jgi:3-methyladenine DNA glycosylase AlkD
VINSDAFEEFQMEQRMQLSDAGSLASQIDAALHALPVRNTSAARALRRQYSRELKQAAPAFILALASELMEKYDQRWLAYEFIRYHPAAFRHIGQAELEAFGRGIHSWDTVDAFARTLAGPAWLNGQISDAVIHEWARSEDLWWRRAALVSTVALNVRSQGGAGDVARTLAVCRLLAADREDMVAGAMSWALRELVVHDAGAVREFLAEHEAELPARVKREVRNKLSTGLKNPKGPNQI